MLAKQSDEQLEMAVHSVTAAMEKLESLCVSDRPKALQPSQG